MVVTPEKNHTSAENRLLLRVLKRAKKKMVENVESVVLLTFSFYFSLLFFFSQPAAVESGGICDLPGSSPKNDVQASESQVTVVVEKKNT